MHSHYGSEINLGMIIAFGGASKPNGFYYAQLHASCHWYIAGNKLSESGMGFMSLSTRLLLN